jgi:transposase
MVQGKLTSIELQQQVITLSQLGKKTKEIMEMTGMPKSSINKIIKRGSIKYKCQYNNPPGRPQKINKSQKTKMRKFVKENNRKTQSQTKSYLNLNVSKSTISRVFKKIGISRRKLKQKPTLTPLHKKERFSFARARVNLDYDWDKFIFSDEKKFNLDGPDGYKYFWKIEGDDNEIYSRDSNSRKSVMVWGGISKNGITSLVEVPTKMNSKKYCDILKEGLIPYYDDGDVFQQDGAKCHTSKETLKFLKDNKIETFKWPSKSPDLSPIENIWSYIVKDIYYGKPTYKIKEKLMKIYE